jgi:HAD superfamily hydrolase (TIGR01509 family)
MDAGRSIDDNARHRPTLRTDLPMAIIDAKSVRVLLFDLGGVLIEVDPLRSYEHWARAAGVDAAVLRGRSIAEEDFRRHECGEISEAAFFEALRTRLGLRLDDAEIAAGWNARLGDAIPGARAQLERAASMCPTYLFSNSNRTHREHWSARHADMLASFAGCFVSCDIGRRKPDPMAFRDVAGLIGCPPSRILFFDDLAQNVEGARRAGLQAVRVRGPADIARALDEIEAALPAGGIS